MHEISQYDSTITVETDCKDYFIFLDTNLRIRFLIFTEELQKTYITYYYEQMIQESW